MSNPDDNNDLNDGLDQTEEFDTDLGFDDVPAGQDVKNNPLVKIGLVAAGFVIILVGIFYLGSGGNADKTPSSQVASVPEEQNALPAQKEPTPEYKQAVVDYNQKQVEEAKKTGESYIAIPTDPSHQNIENNAAATQEDAAERFRQIQDEYNRQQEQERQKQASEQAAANAAARAQHISDMASAMSGYLSSIASTRTPKGMMDADAGFSSGQSGLAGASAGAENAAAGMYGNMPAGAAAGVSPVAAQVAPPKVLIPATKIEYGQLLIEANTDAPGPVLGMLASGQLSGSRLLGNFQKTGKYLTLRFTQLVTKSGQNIPIQAIVLDPSTTLPGMITEIDHRYFERYIIPAAAQFVSGVGQALAETQTSTTQNSSSTTTSSKDPNFSEAIAQGVSESFNGISNAMKDEAGRAQPMLRVAAGTPIGILFTQNVNDPNTITPAWQQQQIQQRQLEQMQSGNMGMMPYAMQMGGYSGQGGYTLPAAMMNAVGGVPSSYGYYGAGTGMQTGQ